MLHDGGIAADDDDGVKVLFRLSNRQVPTKCLTASYVAFDGFVPEPSALVDLHVFERCVSHRDFERIVDVINNLMLPYRSKSLWTSCVAIFLSFGAVAILVLLSVPGGVTMQVLTFLVHTLAQAALRSHFVAKANNLLDDVVNGALTAGRGVFVILDAHHEGCSNFMDVDFCVRRVRRSEERNNPLHSSVLISATSGSFSARSS